MLRKRKVRRGGSLLAWLAATFLLAASGAAAQSPATDSLPDAPSHAQEPHPCVQKDCPAPPEVVEPPKSGPAGLILNPLEKLGGEVQQVVKQKAPCDPREVPCQLTPHQKFQLFVKRTYSPYTFASAAFDAGYSQLFGDNYGPGMEGWAKRYGANLADGEVRSFFQTFLFSSLWKQDPRFHRLGNGNIFYRTAYAASRVAVGRRDDGTPAFNAPEFAGVAVTVALGNAYYPDKDKGGVETLNRGLSAVFSDATTNLLKEFWPDIHRFFHRHAPEPMQRVERKIEKDEPRAEPKKTPPKQ